MLCILTPPCAVLFQEPEDDPRFFVYLWVVYGPHRYEYKANSRSRIVLYQLSYQERERNRDVAFVYRVSAVEPHLGLLWQQGHLCAADTSISGHQW